tara:strand:- start:9752 stop:9958 length:207 start_codon:yes stop_codon:yes gene_type:complete
MYYGELHTQSTTERKIMKKKCDSRISISLSKEQHKQLVELSDRKDASIAWVVRQAITEYLIKKNNNDD